MPSAAAQKTKKAPVSLPGRGYLRRDDAYYNRECLVWLGLCAAGAVLGFCAPGFDQWYLAWFGLVPFLVAAAASRNAAEAFWRGMAFGTCYNLVYLFWNLQYTPYVWPDWIRAFTAVPNTTVWLLFSLVQGALFGAFAAITTRLPMAGGFMPRRAERKWKLPSLMVLPLLWVLIVNKLGNIQGTMAVPWSMLEYSQYGLKELIQIASVIGGIGIGALIFLSNATLAGVVLTGRTDAAGRKLGFANKTQAVFGVGLTVMLIGGCLWFGHERLAGRPDESGKPRSTVSILQGNILWGINSENDMKHWHRYKKLASMCPPYGICVWPEWSFVVPVSASPESYEWIGKWASFFKQSWIIGAVDYDDDGRSYNVACGLNRYGELIEPVYRKQFLVPFGEYTPQWILRSPFGIFCGTLTPRGEGYAPGNKTEVFDLDGHKVAPIICCELMSPEITAEGVRKGGQLIVDCSNTMWFQSNLVGHQNIAACVFRAVENHRYFAFATSVGPSAIIDSYGNVLQTAMLDEPARLTEEVCFEDDITPFTRWFR